MFFSDPLAADDQRHHTDRLDSNWTYWTYIAHRRQFTNHQLTTTITIS
jgi:hypothetical protein